VAAQQHKPLQRPVAKNTLARHTCGKASKQQAQKFGRRPAVADAKLLHDELFTTQPADRGEGTRQRNRAKLQL
jgi:hypothetical protein